MDEEQTKDSENEEATMIPDPERWTEIIWGGWSLKAVQNFDKSENK